MGVIAFVIELAFTAIGVALVVEASRLGRFPLVHREVTPGDPYRGARDAGPTRDPGLDQLVTGDGRPRSRRGALARELSLQHVAGAPVRA